MTTKHTTITKKPQKHNLTVQQTNWTNLTLWTLYSVVVSHPVPWSPRFCHHQVCAGRSWCHSGYICIRYDCCWPVSRLCALKLWPVFQPLEFKGLISQMTLSLSPPAFQCIVIIIAKSVKITISRHDSMIFVYSCSHWRLSFRHS